MSVIKEKTYYTETELAEFEAIILKKLTATNNEIEFISRTLSRKDDNGTDNTAVGSKTLEDGADMREKERLNQASGRLKKFSSQLEAALIRIKNGTYGTCKDTGKLIPAERLRAVPHTSQTIEAKLARK
jgi:DnaK suppressor protein